MRRSTLVFALLFLLLATPAHPFGPAIQAVVSAGTAAASCTKANVPNGDVYKESFEDAGYDLGAGANAWQESGTPDEDKSLSGLGTATNQNCAYGLQTTSTGTVVYSWYHLAANKPEIWRKFSFYIVSHSLTNGQTVYIACAASGADCTGQVLGRATVNFTTSGGDKIQTYGIADSTSTARTIATGTWYYVTLHLFDKGGCTDVNTPYAGCTGSGTGNNTISVGTTFDGTDIANADTFGATDVLVNPDEWILGVLTASRTIDIIFGYDAVDDDGTF
jgi:hypothetical protein